MLTGCITEEDKSEPVADASSGDAQTDQSMPDTSMRDVGESRGDGDMAVPPPPPDKGVALMPFGMGISEPIDMSPYPEIGPVILIDEGLPPRGCEGLNASQDLSPAEDCRLSIFDPSSCTPARRGVFCDQPVNYCGPEVINPGSVSACCTGEVWQELESDTDLCERQGGGDMAVPPPDQGVDLIPLDMGMLD